MSKRQFHHLQKEDKTAQDLIPTVRMDLPEDMKTTECAGAKFHKLFKLSMANDGSTVEYKDKWENLYTDI